MAFFDTLARSPIFIPCTERFSDIIASINDSCRLVHLSDHQKNGGNVNDKGRTGGKNCPKLRIPKNWQRLL
jgi:hypothetical protein